MKNALAFALVFGLGASAHAASSAILEKHTTETAGTGKFRTTACYVSMDGVVITRTFDGITTTEEKTFKISGPIDTKIEEAATVSLETKKASAIGFSFSFIARRTGGDVNLGSLDGFKGEEVTNPSLAAGLLKEILLNACGK